MKQTKIYVWNEKDPKQSIQQMVDEYVETVNAARARWAHRKCGGQSGRTIGAAIKTLRTKVAKWGYSETQIRQVLADARDLAALEYAAVEEGQACVPSRQ